MTLSSTKAKYKALTDKTTEIAWLKCLFFELGLNFVAPFMLWYDNQSLVL